MSTPHSRLFSVTPITSWPRVYVDLLTQSTLKHGDRLKFVCFLHGNGAGLGDVLEIVREQLSDESARKSVEQTLSQLKEHPRKYWYYDVNSCVYKNFEGAIMRMGSKSSMKLELWNEFCFRHVTTLEMSKRFFAAHDDVDPNVFF